MITYNSPEHAKERQNVVPLTDNENKIVVAALSRMLSIMEDEELSLMKDNYSQDEYVKSTIQRLIDHYSNLQYFHDVVGGWEGLDKIKEAMYDKGFQDSAHYALRAEGLDLNAICDTKADSIPQPTGIHPPSDEVTELQYINVLKTPIVQCELLAYVSTDSVSERGEILIAKSEEAITSQGFKVTHWISNAINHDWTIEGLEEQKPTQTNIYRQIFCYIKYY